MTLGSEKNYINVADKLRMGRVSIGVDRRRGLPNNRLRTFVDIPNFHPRFHLNNDAGKLSRLMVVTRKYKETMTCRLAEGRSDSVLYVEDSG
jgi:murein L,D-transpeptidase YcbB/YkuD